MKDSAITLNIFRGREETMPVEITEDGRGFIGRHQTIDEAIAWVVDYKRRTNNNGQVFGETDNYRFVIL